MPCPGTRWVSTFSKSGLGFRRGVGLLEREGEGISLAHHWLPGEGFGEALEGGRLAQLTGGRVAVLQADANRIGKRHLELTRFLNPSGPQEGEQRGRAFVHDTTRADRAGAALPLLLALLLDQAGRLADGQSAACGQLLCSLSRDLVDIEGLANRARGRDQSQVHLAWSDGDRGPGGGVSLTGTEVRLSGGSAALDQGLLRSGVTSLRCSDAPLTRDHGVDLPLDQNSLVHFPCKTKLSGAPGERPVGSRGPSWPYGRQRLDDGRGRWRSGSGPGQARPGAARGGGGLAAARRASSSSSSRTRARRASSPSSSSRVAISAPPAGRLQVPRRSCRAGS
jgi:hypothetical protein